MADRLVITKVDLASEAGLRALGLELGEINPTAVIAHSTIGAAVDAAGMFDDVEPEREVRRWLAEAPAPSRHGRIGSFVLEVEQPIEWAAFGVWLSLLLHRHGERILRVKGLVRVRDCAQPVVIQGVQHVVFPPT